ncbi:MAG: alpha-amylase [Owenweeksia sp.]|nr:alpha-amylase [Owenweeksia sp.]
MKSVLFFLTALALVSCENTDPSETVTKKKSDGVQHPTWSEQAVIYEVNIRQHTPEGTFKAFQEKLPEIKELGAKILWIMPVQPIGEKNRKGGLGSYYSIKDYTAVNPEFGTLEDFRALVDTAHAMGFKILLDWVGNHSAWDNVWIEKHPDWYTHDREGNIVPPVEDWSDVADLNYDNKELRVAMQEAMKWWVTETDIDGYRCDVAYMVPMDFWNQTRKILDSIKPVFMLAEAEGPDFHKYAFDMTYGWELHHLMNKIAKGEAPVDTLEDYSAKSDTLYSASALRMYFTSNHDENSWNGTVYERMGVNHKNFFVLSATLENGMPLIYGGQEWGLSKSLSFFEKDTINGSDTALFNFYKSIVTLKNTHPALHNGEDQGVMQQLHSQVPSVYAFKRIKNGRELFVAINFDREEVTFPVEGLSSEGSWSDALTGSEMKKPADNNLKIPANDYLLIDITTKE